MNKETAAQHIDHTLLSPSASRSDIEQVCKEAMEYNFKAVCVNSCWVSYASELLQNSGVLVATVVGFPLGAMSTEAKSFEASNAVSDGANEVDIVINIGLIKSSEWNAVSNDLSSVISACNANSVEHVVTKVIIETGLLNEAEKVAATKCALDAGADYVKTCTGFNTGAATVEDVKMMKLMGAEHIKASGGVRTLEALEAMIEAGADRIGTSNGVAIISEFDNIENTASTAY